MIKRRRWTKDEDAKLEAFYTRGVGGPLRNLAASIGRTHEAVMSRASLLELTGMRRRAPCEKRGKPIGPKREPKDPVVAALVRARIEQQISVEELARRSGYSAAVLHDWEGEKTSPTLVRLRDWAAALGVSGLLLEITPQLH